MNPHVWNSLFQKDLQQMSKCLKKRITVTPPTPGLPPSELRLLPPSHPSSACYHPFSESLRLASAHRPGIAGVHDLRPEVQHRAAAPPLTVRGVRTAWQDVKGRASNGNDLGNQGFFNVIDLEISKKSKDGNWPKHVNKQLRRWCAVPSKAASFSALLMSLLQGPVLVTSDVHPSPDTSKPHTNSHPNPPPQLPRAQPLR